MAGDALGLPLGAALGGALGAALGTSLPISVGSVLGIGAVSLAVGAHLIKRKKKTS